MKKIWNCIAAAGIAVLPVLLLGGSPTPAAAFFGSSTTELSNSDCVKCHAVKFEQLQDGGSKHKSKVSCIDCHKGEHPPRSEKGSLIPKCEQCHKDAPHFTLENCTACHQNPHQPLAIVIAEGQGQKPACKTCHPEQVNEVDSHKTSHTGFACSFCHKKHRDRPNCLSCHEPHSDGQKFEDCIKCHQAHQPLTLEYDSNVPNSACGACHSEINEILEAGAKKHSKFQCVFCHANKHAVIPACQDCHEAPHDQKMVSNFASCNECHQSAHDILK